MGGTHGNEMSGLALLNPSVKSLLTNEFPVLNLHFDLGNPAAVEQNTRFTEEDLNRQFTLDNLEDKQDNSSFEANLARNFNNKWGPKGNSATDLIIDIHNTTSAMGATLIILTLDDFHIGLARYVKHHMPHANILVEDEKSELNHPYLCTVGKRGVMIEVGAQPQGVCRAEMSELTLEMTRFILAYCQHYNAKDGDLGSLTSVEGYRLTGTQYYPTEKDDEECSPLRQWMIHKNLQDNDFVALKSGDPVFQSLTGEIKYWQGNTTYPHFINEAAYHKLAVAFATADLIEI